MIDNWGVSRYNLIIMLIQRYISASIAKAFLAALAVLSCVMIIAEWVQMGKFLTIRDSDLLLLATVPMGRYVIPMALLFGVLLVLERLSSDSEIIAMKACGVKKNALYRPVIEFSVLCMLINLAISTYLGPLSMERIQRRLIAEAPARIYSLIKERDFMETFKGVTIYVESVNPAKRRIQRIFIETQGKNHYIVTAERGSLDLKESKILMRLKNGSLFMESDPLIRYITFEEYDFLLDVNLGKELGIKTWETTTQPQLKEIITKDPDPKWVKEYHNRYSFPILNIILGLVGIAFGIQKPRSPRYTGFITGIGTIFGYYLLFLLADRLVKAKELSPVLGAWLPNIFFCLMLLGLWVWRRLRFAEA
jgi:LPS export ABC transporter permease LptF